MNAVKVLARTIPVLFLAAAMGCSKSGPASSPFAHRRAVFHVKAGPDTATSPVEGNYPRDGRGRPKEYQGGMALLQGAIEVRYEFVGTAFCPVSAGGREWNCSDVYVLVITTDRTASETIPVVYRGGKMVVVDRPSLHVVLSQEGREPAHAADLAALED